MKWSRNILAAALAGLFLAGCGGAGDAAEAEECMALLGQAQEKMAELSSLRSELKTGVSLSFGENNLKYEITTKLASTAEPFRTQFEMTEQVDGNTESYWGYAEKDDTGLVMYVDVDGAWAGMRLPDGEAAQYDAKGNVGLFLGGMEDCRKSGDSIDGVETDKIEGMIRGEVMTAALEGSANTLSIIEGLGMSLEDIQDEVSELPITVWIDADGYVRRLEMDATEMTDFLIRHMGAQGEDIHADRYATVMQFSDFDAVGPIEIPAETKDAVMLEE